MLKFEVITPDVLIKNGSGGGQPARVLEQESLPITVGKLPTCNLCIDDPSVTRVHAKIEAIGSEFQVADRASAKGTYINGQRVTKAKFANGDTLKFGEVEIRVTFVAASVAPVAAPPAAVPAFGNAFGNTDVAPVVPSDPVQPVSAAPMAAPAAPVVSAPVVQEKPAPVAAPAANKPVIPRSTGGGFGAKRTSGANPLSNPFAAKEKKPERKRREFVAFERRFLSGKLDVARASSGILEVGLTWHDTVLSITQYDSGKGSIVTLGADIRLATIPVNDDRIGRIAPLIYRDDKEWRLFYKDWMDGFVVANVSGNPDYKCPLKEAASMGVATPFEKAVSFDPKVNTELCAKIKESLSIPINGENRVKIVLGDFCIYVHYVKKVSFIPGATVGAKAEKNLTKGLLISLLVHLLFLSLVIFSTDRVDALVIDKLLTASRFAEALMTEEQKVEEEEEEEEKKEEEEEEEKSDEVAEEENANDDVKLDVPNPDNGPKLTKEQNTEAAMNSGLLAQANEMNSLLGAGFDSGAFDSIDDWGSFDQSAAAAVGSNYGLGMAGSGRAGGGSQGGGFGAGALGTVGRGGAGASKYNIKDVDTGERKQVQPKLKAGNPNVSGSIDKRIVQKVVKQHHNELRACYEREVAKKKGLAGKITVRWIIAPTGDVMKAIVMETTMNDSVVEKCVTDSIKYWRFPPMKGGAPVQVDYPFVFELGGG